MSFRDEKRRFSCEKGQRPESGRVDGGLINQKDRDVIADGIDAVTSVAFEGFWVCLEDERLFAHGADQDFEQVLRNHTANCTTGRLGN